MALLPIRPRVSANGSTLGTHQAWPEQGHGEVAGEVVDVDDQSMATLVTLDIERTHAVRSMLAKSMGSIFGTGARNENPLTR